MRPQVIDKPASFSLEYIVRPVHNIPTDALVNKIIEMKAGLFLLLHAVSPSPCFGQEGK